MVKQKHDNYYYKKSSVFNRHAEEERRLAEFFCESVRRNCIEKPFDLSKSPEKLRVELLERFLDGYYTKMSTLLNSILRSYVPDHYEQIREFVSPHDLRVNRPNQLVSMFLNSILPVEKHRICTKSNELKSFVCDTLLQELEDTCGCVIFFKHLSGKWNRDFKPSLDEACKHSGVTIYNKKPQFAFSQKQFPEKSKNQDLLLKLYLSVVKDFLVNADNHIVLNMNPKDYDELWTVVESFLTNAEDRMTDETKLNPAFLQAKEKSRKFFKNTRERLFSARTYQGHRGEYYTSLKTAIKNFKQMTPTEADEEIMLDFGKRIRLLRKALDVVDANGKSYPANYFKCMPIHPVNFLECLRGFGEIQQIYHIDENTSVEDLEDVKRKFSKNFDGRHKANSGDKCETDFVLTQFKGVKYINPDGVVDLSNEEGFQHFVNQVDQVIEENDLPRSAICIEIVADSLRMCRNPIEMPNFSTVDEKIKV